MSVSGVQHYHYYTELCFRKLINYNVCIIPHTATAKVSLSQCLIKHHGMTMHGLVEIQLHKFLTLAAKEGKWLG